MSTSKNKSLIFIIAVLLLTNIAVLGYFLWFKKSPRQEGPGRSPGIEAALQKEVGFNDQQIAQYKQLKEEQWKNFRPMFDDMHKAKDSLFNLLSYENVNDSVINTTADVIAQKQKAIDIRMFNHFRQVRSLCTPEQLPKYDSLIQRMMRKMGRSHKEADKKDKK
jgi:protein CpxP